MRLFAFAGLAALAVGVSACATDSKPMATKPAAPHQMVALDVADQPVVRRTVTIAHIEMPADGFVVIHETTRDGRPIAPASIGHTAVKKGISDNVVVRLTKRVRRGAKLIAMLHVDTGRMGVYEFGPRRTAQDKPLMMNGGPVVKAFTVR
ncbi:MAG: hypothetical protein KIT16_04410 [Rhodospirillaceae bacterium]|nr:hypothetical protein [Rhodospirillaceae bacterium]